MAPFLLFHSPMLWPRRRQDSDAESGGEYESLGGDVAVVITMPLRPTSLAPANEHPMNDYALGVAHVRCINDSRGDGRFVPPQNDS